MLQAVELGGANLAGKGYDAVVFCEADLASAFF
jgi:hypothetical protein